MQSAPLFAEFLGFNLVDTIHYEIWDRIIHRKKKHVLLLMFRNGIKSTIFNYVDNVLRLTKNPKTSGMIFSAVHPISKSMLMATSHILENNEKYVKFFGNEPKRNYKKGIYYPYQMFSKRNLIVLSAFWNKIVQVNFDAVSYTHLTLPTN